MTVRPSAAWRLALAGLPWLLATRPSAALPCDDIPLPNKVFGSGGSKITSTLKRVALAIANDPEGTPAEQTTIFYTDPNTCDGFSDFLSGTSTRLFKYWVAGQTADQTCEARVGGQPLDFAYLTIDRAYCGARTLPAGVIELPAPAHSISLITGLTPSGGSQEKSISAEALYLIYGWGHAGQVAPWTGGNGIFAPNGFVRDLLGLAIRLPRERFYSDTLSSSGNVVTAITTSVGTDDVKAAQAIGFVDSATADTNRSKVKRLAYQHFGQACGVLPDSTPTSLDKRNVRLGKYALWEQGSFLMRVGSLGLPIDPRVSNLLGWFDGATQPPGTRVDALDEAIKAGDVPDCAMQVTRSGVFGPISSYAPPKPCGCRFEAVGNGASICNRCDSDADCKRAARSCNFGYCEAYREAGASEG